MADLSGRESVELTIRAAQAARAILGLVGIKDRVLAKLVIAESVNELKGIAALIEHPICEPPTP